MPGEVSARESVLHRRRQFVTSLTRWISVALALVLLLLSSDDRLSRNWALVAVGAYVAFFVTSRRLLARRPRSRGLKMTHDVVDAVAIGAVAAFTGGPRSPIALILYPHVVALS